jgi:hypothetical protein
MLLLSLLRAFMEVHFKPLTILIRFKLCGTGRIPRHAAVGWLTHALIMTNSVPASARYIVNEKFLFKKDLLKVQPPFTATSVYH